MKRNSRGSALLLVTALLIVFIGLAAASMAIVSHNYSAALRDHDAELAFTYAESGIDDAINELNAQRDYGSDGLGSTRSPIGRGAYSVTIHPAYAGLGRYVLRADGSCGDEVRGIVAVVAPEGLGADRFSAALFGDVLVNIRQNAAIDSWDSRTGDYSLKRTNRFRNQLYANAKSHVKSNYGVRLGANAKVFGDVTTGTYGETELTSNAHVAGVVTNTVASEKLPPVEVPEIPSAGNYAVSAGGRFTMGQGEHHYGSFALMERATLKITGPAVVVFDDFVAGPGARIEIDGGAGQVTIYGVGTFQLDPTAEWHCATKNASDLTIKIATDTTTPPGLVVEIDASGTFYGTIYAPKAGLTLDSDMELFGAVSARSIEIGPGFQIHYDEALAPPPSNPVYRLVSWAEEPAKKRKK